VIEPAPAATVIVVRPGASGPEVLLLRRTTRASFMANVWVYPGGRVDEGDHVDGQDPFVVAARREAVEEAGVVLTNELVFCAHWITPESERKRFDTRFFLTVVAAETSAVADTTEVTDAIWISAADALARHAERDLPLSPPTWVTLSELAACADLDAMLAWARAARPTPIMPSLTLRDGRAQVDLHGGLLVLVDGCWRRA